MDSSKWLVVFIGAVLAGAGCGSGSAGSSDGRPHDADVDTAIDTAPVSDGGPVGDGPAGDGGPTLDGGPSVDSGSDGGGTDDLGGPIAACASDVGMRVPPAPLRRLSNFEYANSVRDMLGLSLPTNPLPLGGDVSDDVATLTALTDGYHRVAHDFALATAQSTASLDAFGKCDVAASSEATCAQRFVATLVPRLFRRPLDPDDASEFADVFANGRALGGDYASGIRAVLEVAMQSPEFLYRVEFGEAVDPGRPGLGRPRPFEMATRLSYLLSATAPDEMLNAAAAQDQLKTKAQIEGQARRLLAGTHAHDVTRDFYARLWRLGDVAPGGNGPAAGEETTRFVDEVVWVGGGDLHTLLTAPFSFVNESLAQIYGIPGVSGTTFMRANLPAPQRRGVLTQLSLLAPRATADGKLTHPSQRGALIFEQLLCGDLSKTPPAEQHMAAGRNTGETARQWLQRVTAPSTCQSCHAQIDPLGLGFEHYASDGTWRDTDSGAVIDVRGALTGIDAAGTFDGAIELIERLASSRDVRACHVRKWMESAYGRALVAEDACSRGQLEQGFERTTGNIRDLMIGLTQTEAFLYRPAP